MEDKMELDIETIMDSVRKTAEENRVNGMPLKYAISIRGGEKEAENYNKMYLRSYLEEAFRCYAYTFGRDYGSGIKGIVKKILSLIIRPAARPVLDKQIEFNRDFVQLVNQVELRLKLDEITDKDNINLFLNNYESKLEKMNNACDVMENTNNDLKFR